MKNGETDNEKYKKIISSALLTLTLLGYGVPNTASASFERPYISPSIEINEIKEKSFENLSKDSQNFELLEIKQDIFKNLKDAQDAWTLAEKQFTSQNWEAASYRFKKAAKILDNYCLDLNDCQSYKCTSLSFIAKAYAYMASTKENLQEDGCYVLEGHFKKQKIV